VTLGDQIRQFISKNFYVPDPAALSETSSFLDLGIIDSTGVLELVCFLETTFGIQVADEDMLPENLDSIRAIASYVTRKLNARQIELVA
jgi:acyl carrier protein